MSLFVITPPQSGGLVETHIRETFGIRDGERFTIPYPLPNMKVMKPADFWFSFHSLAQPQAMVWLPTRRFGKAYASPIVFFVGKGFLHKGGYAVLNVTKSSRRPAHNQYFEWSICDKGFTQTRLSTHEYKQTCNVCGYNFSLESS